MFGSKPKYTCDCCGNGTDEVKDICLECYNQHFLSKQPIEHQVRTKMSKEDLKIIEQQKREEPPIVQEEYKQLEVEE